MDDKLIQLFHEESQENVDSLEKGLLDLEDSDDRELINAVFREAHTIKGNAAIVGYEDVVELTHHMESLLDAIRKDRIKPGAEAVGVLLGGVDALKVLIDSHLGGHALEPPSEVLAALDRLLMQAPGRPQAINQPGEPSPAPAPPKAPALKPPQPEAPLDSGKQYRITMRFRPDLFSSGTDPLMLLMELEELGGITDLTCHAEDLPSFDQMVFDELYLWWELTLETPEPLSAVQDVFIFVSDDNQILIEQLGAEPTADRGHEASPAQFPARSASGAGRQAPEPAGPPGITPQDPRPPASKTTSPHPAKSAVSIRVGTEKLDSLVNLVGELVIGVARINQLCTQEAADVLLDAVESLDQISRDMQEQVMRVRMIPLKNTFNSYKRVVRDLAQELGKTIKLEMKGAETELDKNVIEQVADPIKHLIRNCADHGLETPAQRLAAGKPEQGTIWLNAYQQEGKIIIEVSDDGRGIDHQKVVSQAVRRGLLAPGTELSCDQANSYLFQPGFSTADEVTELSGRGVGLDVVRQNIERLRGSVKVESSPDRGCTFRIKLPLTLAIIDGMTVSIGDEVLTLPMLSIVESIRPKRKDLKQLDATGEMILVHGEYLPLVRLYKVFNFPTSRTDPCQALVVVMESVGRRFGILVDDILGEQQAVIKNLEQNYVKVPGIAGATILGDGRVSLILDVHSLEAMVFA